MAAHGSAGRMLGTGGRPHPLDPLSPREFTEVRDILAAEGLVTDTTRFAYTGLEEPPKDAVLRRDAETPHAPAAEPAAAPDIPAPDRRARVLLLDARTGGAEDVVVSITDRRVVARRPLDPATDGQVPLLQGEHALVRRVLRTDEGWAKALADRGITDQDTVYLAALSAGHFDLPGEEGRRLARVLAHRQPTPESLPWAHPIDGLVAFVDLIEERVLEIVDTGPQPVPGESGDYHRPEVAGEPRTTQRPIEITQPDGPSFEIDGPLVTWEKWSLRLGFDMREGLVLHRIGFDDQGRTRPVVYRASVAEMLVPYADPGPIRFWQAYFDTGEYQLGRLANALELGCDCLGEITYFDVTVAGEDGRPVVLPNAICMHEEDAGVLWKHTDPANGSRETRRQRRLVISFFTTVGNYDYGFYWYLYLDGTIELEVKATGIVFTGAYDERVAPYASQVAPGLAAPYHQHLFGVRLDMMVDGVENAVDEVDVVPVPMGDGNPHGNAFGRAATRLRTEHEAQRDADPARNRVWHVVNPSAHNRMGDPVGYALFPEAGPALMADAASPIAARAGFAARHLWVTRHDPAERYPSGDLPNRHPGGAGLPAYAAAGRDIDGQDIVLWHTFGLTHFPRLEDWPVMPVDTCGFVLRPVGFFDRNPTLDVPPSTAAHCADGDGACCGC